MDIPRVMWSINQGQFRGMKWGSCSQTYMQNDQGETVLNTYENFASKWPSKNPQLPTKEEMEEHWQLVSTMDMSQVLATINGGIYVAAMSVVPPGASYEEASQVWPEGPAMPDYLDCLAHWESMQSEE